MKTGYVTYLVCANFLEGVKTRRMLNAPISMNFKHTLRSYMTPVRQDWRNCIRIEQDKQSDCTTISFVMPVGSRRLLRRVRLDNSILDFMDESLRNLQINETIEDVIESARISAKSALMQEYNRQTLLCYTRNRERYSTYG
ncbi:hypothetical protein EOM81_13385 [bacterium]|nr:hypothetical protein [bacterium]